MGNYMGFRITSSYCWYDDEEIVLMYFINEVPFTFDELPREEEYSPEIIKAASESRSFTSEDLFKTSFYLIDEEAHPLLFEMDLENPQDLPQDYQIT